MANFAKKFVAVSALSALTAGSCFAAVDAGVTTALDAAKADGVAVAGAVLVVIIAIAAFKFIRRAI